ncbi:MAG: 2-oxo acid dehydrogenase subunit E2 [Clostridia bacterium]|nr:2-oxo acid dehydrogenase subunit E2 [Clostridia bacterium]
MAKRPDGRIVKNVEPLQKITPYIMKKRYDSQNMMRNVYDCKPLDDYIAKKAEENVKISYMHILMAAMVRTIALRPQLNRFIMNGRIYTRHDITTSFVIHRSLRDDANDGGGTDLKLHFKGTETIEDVIKVINDAIYENTHNEENGTDKLAKVIMSVPPFMIKGIVNLLMWMDKISILPKAVIELSPFHTSFFVTNVKSIGLDYIYHHVYEFGTTGLFLALGKEKVTPVVDKNTGEIVKKKQVEIGMVSDERFCDGLYFAKSLKLFKKFLSNPELLETPLDAKIEDVK